jgi:uncharacterized membrane protein
MYLNLYITFIIQTYLSYVDINLDCNDVLAPSGILAEFKVSALDAEDRKREIVRVTICLNTETKTSDLKIFLRNGLKGWIK